MICTHNPRLAYLQECLESLRSQSLSMQEWELVVVDNASDSPLDQLINLDWHPQARFERESELGLTAARLRGIRETTGSLVIFVDDDNILEFDYLETACAISNDHPHLGAFGGQSLPRFEQEPAEWTRRFWGNLVIRELSRDSWSNVYHLHDTLPAGAGLCVRRSVAERYALLHESGKRTILLDRAGRQLLSGGDTDLALCALDIGLSSGTFHRLKLTHIIPPGRLDEKYLVDLAAGIAYSAIILRSYRPGAYPPEPRRGLKSAVADALRMVGVDARERRVRRAIKRAEARARRDLASVHPAVGP